MPWGVGFKERDSSRFLAQVCTASGRGGTGPWLKEMRRARRGVVPLTGEQSGVWERSRAVMSSLS